MPRNLIRKKANRQLDLQPKKKSIENNAMQNHGKVSVPKFEK